jgi:hypothetical protein
VAALARFGDPVRIGRPLARETRGRWACGLASDVGPSSTKQESGPATENSDTDEVANKPNDVGLLRAPGRRVAR